jgi:hypothetical protein
MSLATAMDFAKRGYEVLPVGPDKRPWTPAVRQTIMSGLGVDEWQREELDA